MMMRRTTDDLWNDPSEAVCNSSHAGGWEHSCHHCRRGIPGDPGCPRIPGSDSASCQYIGSGGGDQRKSRERAAVPHYCAASGSDRCPPGADRESSQAVPCAAAPADCGSAARPGYSAVIRRRPAAGSSAAAARTARNQIHALRIHVTSICDRVSGDGLPDQHLAGD
jgi:hypothetical protein